MKKFLFPALALGLVMTSCQSDEPFAPGMGEEVQATFTISVPDAMGTRAGEVKNSALGGFTNGAGNLNYTVALLREDGEVMWSSNSPASVNGKSATFNPTVVQGYTYNIVAYATFDAAIEAPAVGSVIPADSGLGAIATLEGINNESEDAYFCNTTILGASSMEATLKRPFGKLRLVAEDYDKLHDLGLEVANVKVTYGGAVVMNTQFDASTKAFEGTAAEKVYEFANETAYSAEADKNTKGVYTVFVDYLPASETGETMYPFEIEVTYKDGKGTYTRSFSQDIPVKRNYLTTLRGNFFTTEAALTLTVNEMFEIPGIDRNIWDGVTTTIPTQTTTITDENGNQVEATVVSTAAELAGLAELVNNGTTPNPAPMTRAGAAINFVLTSDIDLGGYQWTPIGDKERAFTGIFDGNGHTISNLSYENNEEDWYVGLFGNTKNATIKNLKLNNANIHCDKGLHLAALVGNAEGNTIIDNITVTGDVKVYGDIDNVEVGRIGVIVGGNYGEHTIRDININVNEGSFVKGNSSIGGVAGQLQGSATIQNVTSNIDVYAARYFAGGIIGLAPTNTTLEKCSTFGDITLTAGTGANSPYRLGAIAGGWDDNTNTPLILTNCSYTGTLSSSSVIAFDCDGFVGRGYSTKVGAKVSVNGVIFEYKGDGVYEADGKVVVNKGDALVYALENKMDVYFANDIKIDPASMSNAYGKTGVLVYKGQTIDGNGFKLDVKGAGGTWDSGICTSGGLIKDLWVTGGFRGIFVKGADHIEKVVLENVRVEGTTYTISIDQASGQGLEATNSIFRGWTSYAGTIGNVKFTGCTFGAGNGYNFSRPYAPTEYVKCNFETGHQIDPRAAVTFENCTLNGVALTAENLSTLVTSNIANATVK